MVHVVNGAFYTSVGVLSGMKYGWWWCLYNSYINEKIFVSIENNRKEKYTIYWIPHLPMIITMIKKGFTQ